MHREQAYDGRGDLLLGHAAPQLEGGNQFDKKLKTIEQDWKTLPKYFQHWSVFIKMETMFSQY
jgi:hypothetical protein